MDPVSELENALGAELLRAKLLRREAPKLAERYVVERVLGRGASGLVLAALDERLNRSVALKARPVEGDSSMLAEARALARLDHPNVVRVHDVEVVTAHLDGRDFELWLVSMARLDGRTMRAWLREEPRTMGEILAVLIDVGRGLAAAHAERMVHRDVKPDNVFVRADGVAQVLDFGLAVQASASQSGFGGLRPAAGTDPYMAPEARLGRTTRKSDQFSLGITMVEALAGAPVPAGRRAPRGVPAAVWRIAQRATAPDPEDRFPDLPAMVEEMARASRAPAARGSGWASLSIGGVALLALVALASWLWRQIGIEPGPAQLTAPEARFATAPANPEPAGAADAAVGSAAALDDAAAVDGGAADAGAPDAGSELLGDAGPGDAGGADAARCSLRSGRYRFHTVWRTGRRPPVTQGTYRLGIDTRRGLEVSLRRLAPTPKNLELKRVELQEGCVLHLVGDAKNRLYDLWLELDGDAVRGRFAATRDRRGDFAGDVVPFTR